MGNQHSGRRPVVEEVRKLMNMEGNKSLLVLARERDDPDNTPALRVHCAEVIVNKWLPNAATLDISSVSATVSLTPEQYALVFRSLHAPEVGGGVALPTPTSPADSLPPPSSVPSHFDSCPQSAGAQDCKEITINKVDSELGNPPNLIPQ